MMWKDLLSLSRKEQKGFFALVTLFLSLFAFFMLLVWLTKSPQPQIFMQEGFVKNDTISTSQKRSPSIVQYTGFNPNNVSIKQLESMGLKSRTILNWKKYLEAKGTFNNPDDLYKIYSIDSAFVRTISPYLIFDSSHIKSSVSPTVTNVKEEICFVDLNHVSDIELGQLKLVTWKIDSILIWQKQYWFSQKVTLSKLKAVEYSEMKQLLFAIASPRKKARPADLFTFEINQADTAQLDLLKGIGPTLARRIIYYRQKLGGFYNLQQLLEVSGISPATVEQIQSNLTVNTSLIVPVNINKASLRRLKEHPYLGYYKAKEIIDYRQKNGVIKSLDELFQLATFKTTESAALRYYLAL